MLQWSIYDLFKYDKEFRDIKSIIEKVKIATSQQL